MNRAAAHLQRYLGHLLGECSRAFMAHRLLPARAHLAVFPANCLFVTLGQHWCTNNFLLPLEPVERLAQAGYFPNNDQHGS